MVPLLMLFLGILLLAERVLLARLVQDLPLPAVDLVTDLLLFFFDIL